MLVEIKCLRIGKGLDAYIESNLLPHELVEGLYSIADIEGCVKHFNSVQRKAIPVLKKDYFRNVEAYIKKMHRSLKENYAKTISNLKTVNERFMFPGIMNHYRAELNPVIGLYYEYQQARGMPNSNHNSWIIETIAEAEFNAELCAAIEADIASFRDILTRYYWPMCKYEKATPLEIFHATRMISDFERCLAEFRK